MHPCSSSIRPLLRSVILVAAVGTTATALSMACGGQVETTGSKTSQASSEGEADQAKKGDGTPSTSSGAPGSDCKFVSNGGSGGSDGTTATCSHTAEYQCARSGEDRQITCACSAKIGSGTWGGGSCTCGDLTFAFDCTNACQIGAAEYAKCGLPAPNKEPSQPGASSGHSSTSSSSGG